MTVQIDSSLALSTDNDGWHVRSANSRARTHRQMSQPQIIASELSRVMLIAIEVAVEYWLALTWSPQAQWLSEVSKSGIIQDEVKLPAATWVSSCGQCRNFIDWSAAATLVQLIH